MFAVLDATLESWSELRPDGMTLPEERLVSQLPAVSVRVPSGLGSRENARRLNEVFQRGNADAQRAPLFMDWVQAHRGVVHFLCFWRAFGDAAHFVAADAGSRSSGLPGELDALRDGVLLALEAIEGGERRLPAATLVDTVHAVAAASAVPQFWIGIADTAASLASGATDFGMEELAAVVLSWAHQASAWEEQRRQAEAEHEPKKPKGMPVYLHIYDVSQELNVQKLNRMLANQRSPLKLGGVFHAGVEVLGLEWSFGYSEDETVPGVSCGEPKTHPMHHYRETVTLRRTQLTTDDIGGIISTLLEEYPGDDYDLLRRNCCHFADDFCQRLGVGRIPGWIHRLARIGAYLDGAWQQAQGLHEWYQRGSLPDRDATDAE